MFLLATLIASLGNVGASFVPINNVHVGFNTEATLLQNCLLYPNVMSPNLIEIDPNITIHTKLFVNQIHDLDAVSRTFSLTGVLQFSWFVPCVKRLLQNTTSWPQKRLDTLLLDPALFWKPLILHRSGYSEINLQDWDEIFMTLLMKHGEFDEYFTGMFTMLCPMDFKTFPFDEHICEIHLTSIFNMFQRFGNASIEILPGALQKNMNWNLVGTSINKTETGSVGSPELFLFFHFERKSFYYAVTMILPGVALHFLILVSYFLPPDTTDRTVYAATIELAYYFYQIEFNRALPPSSTPLNMQIYLIGMLIGCTVITIYSATLCFIAYSKPNLAKKKVSLLGKRYQLIHVVDFVISFFFFITSEFLAIIPLAMSILG